MLAVFRIFIPVIPLGVEDSMCSFCSGVMVPMPTKPVDPWMKKRLSNVLGVPCSMPKPVVSEEVKAKSFCVGITPVWK